MTDDVERLRRSANARIGLVLSNKYQLDALLGFGGTAAVYLATNTAVRRLCAVKVLHREHSHEPELVERFRREAFAANRVCVEGQPHPNVVDIIDAGESDGHLYLVQELLKGENLSTYLDQFADRRLAPEAAVLLLQPIVHAIATAHSAGVVHRDLKPDNVFLVDRSALGKPPLPKILDFGIAQLRDARITVKDRMHGTPCYMAPESFTDPTSVDARADIWAVGLMLYEMIAGSNPFERPDAPWLAEINAVQEQDPPLPTVSGLSTAIATVIRRCLRKDRAFRFASAAELLRAMETALDPDFIYEVPRGASAEKVREAMLDSDLRCNGLHFVGPWSGVGEMLTIINLDDFSPLRSLILADTPSESVVKSTTKFQSKNVGANELAIAIASSVACRSIAKLEISGGGLTVAGVAALTATVALDTLQSLSLTKNKLADLGAITLADAPHLSWLQCLDLSLNNIGDDGAIAIANGTLTGLTSLDLSHNRITDLGAQALVESTKLTQLSSVHLDGNLLSSAMIDQLRSRGDRLYLV
jgi:serine/threonine protein kinase